MAGRTFYALKFSYSSQAYYSRAGFKCEVWRFATAKARDAWVGPDGGYGYGKRLAAYADWYVTDPGEHKRVRLSDTVY